MDLRKTRPRGRRLVAAVAAAVLLAGAGTWAVAASGDRPAVHRQDRVLDMPGAHIDTSYFTAGTGRRPAVLLGHGFGGSKEDVRDHAEELARDGYAVLTWSARGFGGSTGKIGLNDPDHEVADVRRLIDWLAKRPEVRLDRQGDPRVGVAGASYGGAISLLAAGYDRRVDAIAPEMTYWNLADALFPNGVYKKLWAGLFFTTGAAPFGGAQGGQGDTSGAGGGSGGMGPGGQGGQSGANGGAGQGARTDPGATDGGGAARTDRGQGCGRFEKQLCEMYERVAVAGKPDAAARRLLEARSPSAVADRIKVPTLILQGQADSLFPLGHADDMAKAIRAAGAPVAVDWTAGGHDGGDRETSRVAARTDAWFDRYLKGDKGTDTGPAFRVSRTGGIDTTNGAVQLRGATGDRYPGLGDGGRKVALRGREQSFANPPGAGPPSISTVPGIAGLSQASSLGVGLSLDIPGQFARFDSEPLDRPLRITGSPEVKVRVKADTDDAVLFAKVYDVGPDGQQVLPEQLVAPLRVNGAKQGRTVTVRLPAVDHELIAGHRLRLVLASTDLGYASPDEPATYTVGLADGGLTVPTAPGVHTQPAPLPAWVWGLPLGAAVVALALLLTGRRRTATPPPDPELADVPLQITGLSKRYAKSTDRYAVRELSFRVEKGQVLGLLGPNGAGKTTTLRMLMGLIAPDDGEIRVFGQAIRPGAPVLSRVGAFVEGAGFLPHLTGSANLELYWRATGRPAADAHIEEALEIAGLGSALERAVRTYSQGMRQRLAIAQAMLGLPDLLILDEPTNGLDPPQIREMREVMIRYAAAGRTVIVSSHLLAEVEQSCTHLVVMDRGRLIQAGPVGEITGNGGSVLVGHDGELSDALVGKVGALPGVLSARRTTDGLLVQLDGTTPARLLAELVRLEIPVTAFGPNRRLEDAFLTLIGGGSA
ncbi:alpha/beta fold hydrolase [Streptomyces rapamycinicus]|uniref:ABC transporter ATP-binding protein n=2 Tax=Streptomyces rapamycinicus TaxID=1226757 RepID=A0A0A0N3T1_STRRN|nr:alpha/beta fold hydrolase [Streptomyces rapamycinicus]AGP52727.1 ABC transporter ATP-binding protein [Streptomyces rapamycinicus NRRL 5491]MBB4780202.1 ABC-2 type transport system ATP-binding protein [Streptomyces rapamycinicus]RLV75143.1 ABC transporter ATP-binding protein [Streptomyces rapamycinicus NRRL 5491]UTO60941.1 alpha/beta fold hydrolase [Streptomyces rapamycinicus]UTP28885.1 alpha/beta fold hydrolase [Streptomyces rapamycinicus NRRL 5491]